MLGLVDVGRPVLDAHDLDYLESFRQHDDARHFVFPNELPKVDEGVLQRTLGHDPRLVLLGETPHEAGVDVLPVSYLDSVMVVGQNSVALVLAAVILGFGALARFAFDRLFSRLFFASLCKRSKI